MVGQPRLHDAHELGENEGDNEIDHGHHGERLEILEGFRGVFASPTQKIGHSQDGDQGRIL